MKILDPATVAVPPIPHTATTPLWTEPTEMEYRRQLRQLDIETALFERDGAWDPRRVAA